MSYDLMVFEPAAAPRRYAEFLDWYDQQTEWREGHSYDDPSVCSPELRAWFMDMIQHFPPMNGPLSRSSVPEEDLATATDYGVGKSVIYAAFAGSVGEKAYATMFELARKHGVGFYNVSGEGEVWMPVNGDFIVVSD